MEKGAGVGRGRLDAGDGAGGLRAPVLDAKDAAVTISGLNTVNMSITSAAANNLIKWVDFSIGKNESVTFDANNYLNYVTGSARSEILGALTGGGKIYLVNPNGILIGDGATVNVGSLYLSTKQLDPSALASYDAGISALSTAAIGSGDVINMGNLNATAISVEGNNITFKNVADVKNFAGDAINTDVMLTAKSGGEIHLGFANETEAANVNNSEYAAVNEPTLTGWTTSGTTHKYMLVRNKYELQNMQNNLAGNYMLAKSIDMNGFENFKPIGNKYDSRFVGKFDGLNYAVENLNINTSANDVGLFGFNAGKIENVGMVGGSRIGKNRVGGVAGGNTGTVKHVYSTGTVNGADWVGGVVGQNEGTVENAYNTGAVTGGDWVGGVVGQNPEGSTVENAYNTGTVNGANWGGGVVGQNFANVENVYNAGDVTATGSFKGLIVGQQDGTLTKAYASSNGDLKKAATFMDFGFVNGVSSDGVWRIYEEQTMPLLTAFLTRKDNITSQTAYNGGANVGATYTATNFSGEVAQNGFNYIQDVSIVTPKDLTVTSAIFPSPTTALRTRRQERQHWTAS